MSSDEEFLREINVLDVPPALLGEVMIMWAALPAEVWRDFDKRLEHVLELVSRYDHTTDAPMRAMAVALRVMALDTIIEDPANRGWLVGSGDGIKFVRADLVNIAASEPLRPGPQGHPAFNRQTFQARLMEVTVARGRA